MSTKMHIDYKLQYVTRSAVVDVDGRTIGECLGHFVKQYPELNKFMYTENGEFNDSFKVYVKGEDSNSLDVFKPVKDGDELVLEALVEG